MENSKNIYIIGKVVPHYRTQNLIKYLLDNRYSVYYNSLRPKIYYNTKGFKRIIRLVVLFFDLILKRAFQFYFIAISDVVIMPAMCNKYQFELLLAKGFKKKIITDFYISMYDTFVLDRKKVERGSLEAKKLKKFDFNCIRLANYSLFLNNTEASYYLNLLGIKYSQNKHHILPLCVEELGFKCTLPYYFDDSNAVKIFKICWWGNYIPLHGLEKIISACEVLQKNYDLNFQLHLFGTNNVQAKPYIDIIEELGLTEVVFVDNTKTFGNGELGKFLEHNCDLVLGHFGDSQKAKSVLGNKLIDGVAMKAPVLTGESKAPLEFFSEQDFFYSLNSPESIAQEIFKISRKDKIEINARVESAYAIYKNSFSIPSYRDKLKDLLLKI